MYLNQIVIYTQAYEANTPPEFCVRFILTVFIFALSLNFGETFLSPPSYANTKCGNQLAVMRQIRKRFGDPKGEYHYAMARGPNRRSSIWKACGYVKQGKSASITKNRALKFCRKHSDSCKIIAQFRWTQKKCPTKSCYVWIPK